MFNLRDSRSSILFMYSHIIDDEEKEEERKIDYVNTKNPLDVNIDDRTGCIEMWFVIMSGFFFFINSYNILQKKERHNNLKNFIICLSK